MTLRESSSSGLRAFPMIPRTRFLITAALVCHLLIAHPLVTSQLHSAATPSGGPQSPPNLPRALQSQDVTWSAVSQEEKASVVKLHGKVEIHYGRYVLRADEVTYNTDTREATADGHVTLDSDAFDEHLQAGHANYNFRTETGRFEHVRGTIGVPTGRSQHILTSANPFILTGKVVTETSPDHFVVYDGMVTTCHLPHAKWEFRARKVTVDVGGNAQIYYSDFRLLGIPIFYFPYATHPVERVRQSGFSIPDIGTSSTKGKIVGESGYWAINRSMDVAGGVQYYSLRGWAPRAEFRARPTDDSFVDLNYSAVFDRGFGAQNMNQGGQEVRLQAESLFPHNFRGVANVDFLTSYVYRLAFSEVFAQAINSEVKSHAFLTNTTNGFFNNVLTERYQNFESTTAGDVVTIVHAPTLEASTVDRQIKQTAFYWSYDVTAGGLYRSEPSFRTTPLVGRFNLNPRVSLPLLFHDWSLRPELSLRDTIYTEQLLPGNNTGTASSDPINRKSLEGSVEVRPPAVSRVFDRQVMGRKWKHVIEPRATYRYVTGIQNFANILRFDEQDILSDTNEVEYGVVNRLYAKRTSTEPEDCGPAGMPGLVFGGQAPQSRIPWEQVPESAACQTGPEVREVVTWELAQKYYLDPTFGGALVPGTRNVFAATADLTGIAFLTDARRFSPLVSRLRIQTNSRTDVEWDLDYDVKKGRINASTAILNYRVGAFTLGGGDAFLQPQGETLPSAPLPQPQRFDQYRLLLGYGHANKKGFTGAANLGFDAHLNFLQYASAQTQYNWDCCGFNIEYRRFALGSVRNENQFRFTFSLANISAIGNLKRQERLF
jgi:LPS-assembly protein